MSEVGTATLRLVTHLPRRRDGHHPPMHNPSFPPGEYPGRVRLSPIAWGQRDEKLGRVVCRHLVDANPPIAIPFNPLKDRTIRRELRRLHITH